MQSCNTETNMHTNNETCTQTNKHAHKQACKKPTLWPLGHAASYKKQRNMHTNNHDKQKHKQSWQTQTNWLKNRQAQISIIMDFLWINTMGKS